MRSLSIHTHLESVYIRAYVANHGYLDLSKKSGYARSVNWILFVQYVVPTLVIEQVNKQQTDAPQAKKLPLESLNACNQALLALSRIYAIIL